MDWRHQSAERRTVLERESIEISAIASHIRWIMILSGVLMSTMIYAAIAPEAALTATFGESLNGPLALIIVRNWGALITLVGMMLIYGAFHPSVRPLVLAVAAVSKAVFIGQVLSQGGRYLGHQAGVAIAVDAGDTQSGHSVLSVPGGPSELNAVPFWSIRARFCDECSVR